MLNYEIEGCEELGFVGDSYGKNNTDCYLITFSDIFWVIFLFVFFSLNIKYYRFNLVNGLDNDNRSLIEKYLDKEEQDYLIDHGISVDEFIDYITYDQFHLQYYQYYSIY